MTATALRMTESTRQRRRLSDILGAQLGALAPTIERATSRWGNRPVHEMLAAQIADTGPAWQPREDFLAVVHDTCRDLLGESVAARVREELRVQPVVLTANHHGVDFFAQSVQGSLLFSRRRLPDGSVARTVPVLACGTVPLDNLTYPMGMLIYDAPRLDLDALPRRLPVLPNRMRRELVTLAGPIDAAAPARALDAVRKLLDRGEVHEQGATLIGDLLVEEYGSDETLALPNYSTQATGINARLWRRLHRQDTASEMVYLELEDVCSRLLQRDLANPDSLATRVLLEPRCREDVLARLDGERACWDLQRLRARLEQGAGGGGGTALFWGVTAKKRRVPLLVENEDDGTPVLVGVDDAGTRWRYPLEAESIAAALAEKRLLPAVFSSFLVLAMARGINCLGGYFQAEYLPVMRSAVVAALRAGAADDIADAVAGCRVDGYLGGMQAVLIRRPEGLAPAGLLEMIAGGGLDARLLSRIDAMSVADAHFASLTDTCTELLPRDTLAEGFRGVLAGELHDAFGDDAIVPAATHI